MFTERTLFRGRALLPFAVFFTGLFLVPGAAGREGPDPTKPTAADLANGAVARSEAVFSCRIEFRHLLIHGDKTQPEPGWTKEGSFYFSGKSWAVFKKGEAAAFEASHAGKHVLHRATPQPAGWIGHTAQVSLEKPINHDYPRLPLFAGSFWERDTKAYVKENTRRAVLRGKQEVNGISTHVLEWQVPEADKYKAFSGVGEITKQGGVLRLYVAPQLEYVLPRVEILGPDGTLAKRYDSFDFFEAERGIYFPERCRWQIYNRSGKHKAAEFELKKVEKVNEPIPDEVFKVYLPVGTAVYDGRSGKGTESFVIKKEGALPVEGLDDIVEVGSPPSFWKRNMLPILLGGGVGITAVAAFIFVVRRRRVKGGVLAHERAHSPLAELGQSR